MKIDQAKYKEILARRPDRYGVRVLCIGCGKHHFYARNYRGNVLVPIGAKCRNCKGSMAVKVGPKKAT